MAELDGISTDVISQALPRAFDRTVLRLEDLVCDEGRSGSERGVRWFEDGSEDEETEFDAESNATAFVRCGVTAVRWVGSASMYKSCFSSFAQSSLFSAAGLRSNRSPINTIPFNITPDVQKQSYLAKNCIVVRASSAMTLKISFCHCVNCSRFVDVSNAVQVNVKCSYALVQLSCLDESKRVANMVA